MQCSKFLRTEIEVKNNNECETFEILINSGVLNKFCIAKIFKLHLTKIFNNYFCDIFQGN